MSFILVANIDEALRKSQRRGAKVLLTKQAVPGMGWADGLRARRPRPGPLAGESAGPAALSDAQPSSIRRGYGESVRRPNLKVLAVMSFGIVAAVAAALGCPVFRNPGNYLSAGGVVGYLKYVVDVHRKH